MPCKLRRALQNRRGSSLLLVVVAIMILCVVGFTLLAMSSTSLHVSQNEKTYQAAYYVAESGVRKGLDHLRLAVDQYYAALLALRAGGSASFTTMYENFFPYVLASITQDAPPAGVPALPFAEPACEAIEGVTPRTHTTFTLEGAGDTRTFIITCTATMGGVVRSVEARQQVARVDIQQSSVGVSGLLQYMADSNTMLLSGAQINVAHYVDTIKNDIIFNGTQQNGVYSALLFNNITNVSGDAALNNCNAYTTNTYHEQGIRYIEELPGYAQLVAVHPSYRTPFEMFNNINYEGLPDRHLVYAPNTPQNQYQVTHNWYMNLQPTGKNVNIGTPGKPAVVIGMQGDGRSLVLGKPGTKMVINGIVYSDSNLEIAGDVTINGLLLVRGEIAVGTSNWSSDNRLTVNHDAAMALEAVSNAVHDGALNENFFGGASSGGDASLAGDVYPEEASIAEIKP
nr:hypothetical protein [Maliibacterium massiliense]